MSVLKTKSRRAQIREMTFEHGIPKGQAILLGLQQGSGISFDGHLDDGIALTDGIDHLLVGVVDHASRTRYDARQARGSAHG